MPKNLLAGVVPPGCPASRAAALVLLASVAGCGQSGSEPLLPVAGKVTLARQPLTKGAVVFYPDTAKGNTTRHQPRGTIEADGRYTISTHPRPGAPPGWYRVGVFAKDASDPKNPYALGRALIPEKFSNPDASGLVLEVRRDAPPGAYDLDLR